MDTAAHTILGKTVECESLWLAGMSEADVEEERLRELAELELKIQNYEVRRQRYGLDVDAEFSLSQMRLDYQDLRSETVHIPPTSRSVEADMGE